MPLALPSKYISQFTCDIFKCYTKGKISIQDIIMIYYHIHICLVVVHKLFVCFENYKSKLTIRKTNYAFEMEPKRS